MNRLAQAGGNGGTGEPEGLSHEGSVVDESEEDLSEEEDEDEEDMDDDDMDAEEDFVDGEEDGLGDLENPMDDMDGPDVDPTEVSLGVEDLMGDDALSSAAGLGTIASVTLAASKFKRAIEDGDDVDEQDAANAMTNFDHGANQSSSANMLAAAPV
jgi:hypothetical protein